MLTIYIYIYVINDTRNCVFLSWGFGIEYFTRVTINLKLHQIVIVIDGFMPIFSTTPNKTYKYEKIAIRLFGINRLIIGI